jgi:hypothetical protein
VGLLKNKKPIPTDDVKPWSWYKTWAKILLHPSVESGEAIISEGNISLHQAIIWQGISAFIYIILAGLTLSMVKTQFLSILDDLIFVAEAEIFFLVLTIFIHLQAKVLRRRGSFLKLYILYAAINSPLLIMLGGVFFLSAVFNDRALYLSLYLLLIIYGTTRLYPLPPRIVHRLNWFVAFLISVVVPVILIFSCILTYLYYSNQWE